MLLLFEIVDLSLELVISTMFLCEVSVAWVGGSFEGGLHLCDPNVFEYRPSCESEDTYK